MNIVVRVAISGSSGLIGSALITQLSERRAVQVQRLVRHQPEAGSGDIHWDPQAGKIDESGLRDVDIVVHLAGESIASGRWSEAKKRRIRDSRVQGTTLLAEALAGLERKPKLLISASAVGYYGSDASRHCDESAEVGSGFLAEVCAAWEAAAQPARAAGIRVVHPRLGVVLAKHGGALEKMLPIFSLGLGGKLGSGQQFMSWVTLQDVVKALCWLMDVEHVAGPVNLVAPEAVTNEMFTRALGAALKRPTALPVPKFALRLAMGQQMADELLLGGPRVVPAVLNQAGFEWSHPKLQAALAACLH